jgi:hypothetical protein
MPKPPTLTVKKLIALTPEMAQAIEDFRFTQRINSETEAIRRLIARGLQAHTEQTPATADQPDQVRSRRRKTTGAQ